MIDRVMFLFGVFIIMGGGVAFTEGLKLEGIALWIAGTYIHMIYHFYED